MSFKPLIVAGKKLNENAYRELPQDSMNTGYNTDLFNNCQKCLAASSNSNLSEVIKQERELLEARQLARRRKTFAYDGDISTEIHLTLGISSTEMPSKLEESLQPHSTSSRQSVGPETMKKRNDSNVSSHKKCSENESKLVGDTDIECEKNLTSRSGRLDVQTNVSDKVVAAGEANYQEINSTAAERNEDVNGTVLIESNCSKGSALASENRFYASRNSSRKKSISAQFSSDKKVENSASKTSNSLPSTEKDAVQQFSSSISSLNFDEKYSSSFEKAVNIEREEAYARQLARRRKTLRSGSNYDEIHLTKEMMQLTSSSNTACATRSNSRTKSSDFNSKAQGTSNLVDEDDKMRTSVAMRRTRNSNTRAKSANLNSKAHVTSNLVENDDKMRTSVDAHRTRRNNSRAKSSNFNANALDTSNLGDVDERMHVSVAAHSTRRSNFRAKSGDSNSKVLGASNLPEEDDKMHTSVAMRRTRNSNTRAKSANLNSKSHVTSNLVENDDKMRTSVDAHRTRRNNSRAKSSNFNANALDTSNLGDVDERMHVSVAAHSTRRSNFRAKSGDSNSKVLGASNLPEEDDKMHTSVAMRRTRNSNTRAKSANLNSKAHANSNLVEDYDRKRSSVATDSTRKSNSRAKNDSNSKALVEDYDRMGTSIASSRSGKSNSRAKSGDFDSKTPPVEDDGRMHTSVAAHRTRNSNSRAKSGDSNSKVLGASNLAEEDDKMHTSVAMRRTRNSNTRAKSANFNSKAHATSNLVENDDRMRTSVDAHRTRRSNSRAKSNDFNSDASDTPNLRDVDDRMHVSVAAHRTRNSNSRAKSGDSNSKVLGASNLAEEDDKMHTSVAMRRTRNSNTRAKSANFNSKAHATSNLVENDDRMRTSVDAHRTRRSNSRAKSNDFNSDASDTPNLRDVDDRMHVSVAAHSTRKSNSRAKSANLNSKAHATSNFVEEDNRMRTSIASSRTRKSKSRAKSGDFDSKTPATSNLVEDDDRMHTSVSSALSMEVNSKREAENSDLALWNGTTESKLAVALPVQDHVFKKTPTTRSKKRSFPFSSTPSTNFNKAEVPDLPSLGDLSTIISLHAPEENVSRVDCTNDDATKTALIASSVIEKGEKIANNEILSNKESNEKQTIPDVVPAHSFRSPESCNVRRKKKLEKLGRRGKKNIKRYPAFSTPNLQSGQGDVMKCPVFSSELSSITSVPAKDTNSLKSMDCNENNNQSKSVVAKNSLGQSSSKQRLSCESTEMQSKRLSLKSGSQACDIAAAGNDFGDVKALISENVQKSDVENCQTGNADSDQVMKKSSGCEEIEEIDSKRLADLVSAMSENTSVTPISCFKKPSGSLDNTAILKRFGVDSECDDVLYEEEIDEIIPANRKVLFLSIEKYLKLIKLKIAYKNLSVIQQSASEKEESEEKMSYIAENTNVSFEEDALSLSSDNLSVGRKRSSTAILHNKAKEISNKNGSSSESTSFHSEAECSESIYPVNTRWKKVRKLSTSTERSTSTLSGSENDSGIVTPKRHPRAASLFEQLMRKRISSAMNKATSSAEGSSSQKNDQNSNTSMNDTSIKHYYEQGTPNVSLGYASELPTPKINWGDLRKKTPNLRRSNRTRIPTLRRQLGESVVYRYVNGLPEVERVIHGKVMEKVFLRYGVANSAALVEARRRRRRFLEYRRKMKKLQRERNEALRRRLSLTEAQSSLME
ncbi:hypothetical protein T07_6475 [Trichinella nelsoni]|uniref:Uncharacterized protein n=1 Tax=Trichinella nelsoni TaxID=6336 RepID=A0A0V0SB62_9BILA|nr:hypothetical protein T07_6475 [Trichinella nelsoni]